MPADYEGVEIKRYVKLRSCILKALYELFKEHPYAQVEPGQLLDLCQTDARELNWNLVYLERSGLVELGKAQESHPFIACSVELTARGIDRVEKDFGI